MTDTSIILLSSAALAFIAIGCGTVAYRQWKKDVILSCFTNDYDVPACTESREPSTERTPDGRTTCRERS